jgi:hypothetical protein
VLGAVIVGGMTNTKNPKTTRALFINDRPVPASNRIAHIAARWGRNPDGSKIYAAQLRALLTEHGIDCSNLLGKTWKVSIAPGRVLSSRTVKP